LPPAFVRATAPRRQARRLQNLAKRHGQRTERQRRQLLRSAVRHVIVGNLDIEDANAFLRDLDIEPASGPGRVSFRVSASLAMVYEGAENNIGTFEYRLDEAQRGMRWTRLGGCPTGIAVARPTRPDLETLRRHTVVRADLRLTVTVPAYLSQHLDDTAAMLLDHDLPGLCDQGFVLRGDPTVWDTPPTRTVHVDTTDSGAYLALEDLDEGDYIDYPLELYPEPNETLKAFDPTTPWRLSDRLPADEADAENHIEDDDS
jgi:hypothetical protein